MTLPAGSKSHQIAQKTSAVRNMGIIPKSKSTDSLERLTQGARKPNLQTVPSRSATKRSFVSAPNNISETSRLEVLLAQKTAKQTYTPLEESANSRDVNKAIKQSAQWSDVQQAVKLAGTLTPSNAAYAIHRLGCLNCFASRKRKADLVASGIVPSLLQTATSPHQTLDVGTLVLILDGCARLQHKTPPHVLDSLATAAACMATSFDSLQLPLVLWALSVLHYTPPMSLLTAFDEATPQLADAMSPQGLCLTLSGFQAAVFRPSQRTLDRLTENLHRMLPLFKPSEVACCLEAFSFFTYQPSGSIITAILNQTGQTMPSRDSSRASTAPFSKDAQSAATKSRVKPEKTGPASKMLAAIRSEVRQAEDGKQHKPEASSSVPRFKQLALP